MDIYWTKGGKKEEGKAGRYLNPAFFMGVHKSFGGKVYVDSSVDNADEIKAAYKAADIETTALETAEAKAIKAAEKKAAEALAKAEAEAEAKESENKA